MKKAFVSIALALSAFLRADCGGEPFEEKAISGMSVYAPIRDGINENAERKIQLEDVNKSKAERK